MTATQGPPQPPSWWTGLLDDTAACGPGVTSLPPRAGAVGRHVGALVVPDTLLPAALAARDADPSPARHRLVVRLTGGSAQLGGPAALCARAGVVPSRVDTVVRDPGDPASAARRVAAAVDAARAAGDLPDEVVVAVGLPAPAGPDLGHGWLAAADELAAAELALALPTRDVPPPGVAPWLDAALDRELPLVALGPHPAAEAAALLAAVRLAFDGEPLEEVAAVLRGGEDRVTATLAALGADALLRTRRWLLGVGCDDVEAAGPALERLAGGSAA
ncbi:hypothetical protein [Nocardioides perillae]|uniref:Uncharacterized protein n=1 Tax=Nocardioides perillae TaxID=1119534 RepID=A0A7Y9UKT7_9ACTN|nr:hypothetical protein [Nocardioides perillae]NYG53726.1 hypothetical protein [Nocardioides perillae]